ncbi:Deoxyadenosine/deoxycytidine kinase [Flexibacter flexilis DSM 6793]|uniref:Deoxyadenosine/deoxycytidine kinase n=1 Tax=Flexibacter flexilis DSM 6793 TaxID=927664 RepID=A0A1I1FRT3_9BACT|nr:deoxynucleoside kinase [Flexibacter flexilis]SFC02044.1 Deoxyadenosine/deoxycytidine kinase [Flexibacter flexilis DSM 6793]
MHIAIAGNIGAGKTTLASKLAQHYGWEAHFEAVDNNPYLSDFYEDMNRWSFHLQIFFLNSRIAQIHHIRNSQNPIIQDRTIYEDAYIFAKNLHDSGLMTSRDYQNYLGIFNTMHNFIQPPDLLIYLRADLPKLVGQIEKRGRDYENNIRLEYLKNLNKHYEDWISTYKESRLLIIDVNQLDYAARAEDLQLIIQKVDESLAQIA